MKQNALYVKGLDGYGATKRRDYVGDVLTAMEQEERTMTKLTDTRQWMIDDMYGRLSEVENKDTNEFGALVLAMAGLLNLYEETNP